MRARAGGAALRQRALTLRAPSRNSMVSAAFTLTVITVFGGLVYFGLERKLARALPAARCASFLWRLPLRRACADGRPQKRARIPQALQLNVNYMVRTVPCGPAQLAQS